MPVVTISRGSASGGLLLAQGLAEKLGYEIVSREDIAHEAARFGVPEDKLQESMVKSPGFWERMSHERRRYLAFVQLALCERAQRDNIVYHGNAGHLLLRGVSHVLRVRLVAPVSFRVRMLMERQMLPEDQALEYLERVDEHRKNWTQFLYGVDWLDPTLCDISVNLETLALESAVQLVCAAVKRPEFAATANSRRAMDDLLLSSRVRAALAANDETASADVQVDAADGVVRLKGRVRPASMLDAVLGVAREVEGVRELNREHLDAPELIV